MYRIFDVHTHAYPEKIADRAVENLAAFYDFTVDGNGTCAELERVGYAVGTVGFIVFSVATNPKQVEKVNNFIAETANESRARGFQTVGFAGMHQDFPDFASELDRAQSLGLKGVKIHPDIQEVDIDSPKLLPLYELMEGRLPLYLHMGDDRAQYRYSEPKKLARVLDMFPKLEVVAAHLGGYKACDEAREYLAGRENVWYDTSSALWYLTPEYATEQIHVLGADRVMFGTDYPVKFPEGEIRRFLALDLTEKEREDIFYNNAVRFLGLDNPKEIQNV